MILPLNLSAYKECKVRLNTADCDDGVWLTS